MRFIAAFFLIFAIESRFNSGIVAIMSLNSSLFSKACRLIHVSTMVPPHEVLMRPMGICSLLYNLLAKKYPAAVKSPAVALLYTFQSAGAILFRGITLTVLGILIWRIMG